VSLDTIAAKLADGRRLTRADALALFRSDDIFALGEMASAAASRHNGNRAYYVRNMHVNPTNLCVNRCGFCAFSRSRGDADAYELSTDEIIAKIRAALPLSEVHIVGGLHPDWPLGHYLDMVSRILAEFPGLHVKAFTAAEIDYLARMEGVSSRRALQMFREAGLTFMPGGGAEIFDPSVRGRLCPEKISGERWLEVMAEAHETGIRSNATMLYGHVENFSHRVDHLMRLRDLQDQTGGFQAFISLSYHAANTEIGGRGASGIDDLKTIAVSRLVLDNFAHIKAYWVMLGPKVSQLALLFGADDLDGTVVEERITRAAGGTSGAGITEAALVRMIRKAGKRPVERDSFYHPVKRAKKQ
jgi:aminodeoxyfutalosine synthase